MLTEVCSLLLEKRAFFAQLLAEHLAIAAVAVVVAALLGTAIGILISEYQKTSKLTLGVINFVYTIPSISLLGILIPISGIGNATAVIALTIYGLLPMVRNTYTGIGHIDPLLLEAAQGMGATRSQILFGVKLPLAMPVMMSGLRNMTVMTIALAGIASFIGAGGLGVAIYRGITTNDGAMTLAGSLLIALLAIVADLSLGALEKHCQRRKAPGKQKRKLWWAAAAALLCLGVAIGGLGRVSDGGIIRIATKPMTEQYLLGAMLSELIRQETGLQVELTQGVGGGTSNIQPALEKGEFDLYPEYTGTAWNMVLQEQGIYNEAAFPDLQQRYENELGLTWRGMYGFNNTYGLAVRREVAEQYQLQTYSDLAAVAGQLAFGAEYDFYQREDGYGALCRTYGLQFKSTADMDIGLKYQAIQQQQIDVMPIFTTDGQLTVSDLVVLEDDLHFYPSYLCGNVVRLATLEEYPELEPVLTMLEGKISDQVMADLNYQVEAAGKDPEDVAHTFLQQLGLTP